MHSVWVSLKDEILTYLHIDRYVHNSKYAILMNKAKYLVV